MEADGEVAMALNTSVAPQSRTGSLLFAALPDLLLIIDQHKTIVDFNPAAAHFFPLDRCAVAGRRVSVRNVLPGFEHMAECAKSDLATSGNWNGKLIVDDQHGVSRRLDISLWRQPADTKTGEPLTIVMCRDITDQHHRRQTEQHQLEQSLRDSELHFWRVADAAPVMIWQTDRDGKRSCSNRRLLAFTGRVAGREFDTDWHADIHPKDRERCRDAIERAVNAHENFEIDYRLRRHDGVYRWLIDTGMPRYDGAGILEGYVGSCIDISALKKLELSLQRKTTELVEEAARKDAFLAMLSHELRNPLAPIANSLAVMRVVHFPDATSASSFAIIERQFKHLRRLVNELLDVERIANGKIPIHRAPVTLQHTVDRAVETNMPAMRAANHQLTLHLQQPEATVRADAMRVAQALSNLLGNAAKFTENGGVIELDVGVHDTDVFFAVHDNGIGFNKRFETQLFTPFAQADRSPARTRSGLGIGLAMAHQIVQLHGGTITANSDGEGCGSRFVLTLPLLDDPVEFADFADSSFAAPFEQPKEQPTEYRIDYPTDPRSEEQTVPTPTEKAAGFRILLVDDNEDANDSMAALLELLDYDVRTATDSATALKTTAEFEPQLILSDIGLPGMDGYQLAPALRKAAGNRKMVIAAATGYGHASDRARSLAAGFDHHLVKPLDADALLNFVAQQAADY